MRALLCFTSPLQYEELRKQGIDIEKFKKEWEAGKREAQKDNPEL